tara:strand:- start:260 stop:904 length:645 start_codon:yes stop_codon:yes gene_type:complete
MAEIRNINAEMLGRATAFAAKATDVRFYLHGVHIERNPAGGVYIIATNGHILCVYNDPDAEPSADFEEVTLSLKSTIGGTRGIHPYFTHLKKFSERVDIVKSDYKISGDDVWLLHENEFLEVDCHYPDWRRVVNPGLEITETIGFDPRYLAMIKNFMLKSEGGKYMGINLVGGTTRGASIWESDHGLLLIMPMEPRTRDTNELLIIDPEIEEVA